MYLISCLLTESTVILESKKIKSVTVFTFSPSICHEVTELDEAQAQVMIAGRNINNLRYSDDTTRMAERGTEEPLDESERGEWKNWLITQHSKNEDHGIWSHHFLANRWGNSG